MQRLWIIAMLIAASLVVPASARSGDAVADWIRRRAVPLSGAAFRGLDADLRQVRLIGVGESVHEVQEFMAMRFELLRYLVQHQRVTAVVLESGLPEVRALDAYVTGETDAVDLKAVPGELGYFDQFRRSMEWLREWNLRSRRRRVVHVYGSDLPGRAASMIPSLNGLAALVPGQPDVAAAIDGLRPLAALIQDGWLTGASKKYDALPESTKQELTKAVQRLITASDELTPRDTSNVEWAKRLAITVQQMEVTLRLGPLSPSLPRDQALAANTLWILDRLPPDERATYWAHNAHVQKALIKGAPVGNGRFLGSGTLLRQALERRYYAIGTAYGGPSMDDRTPAAAGSLDQALEQAVDRSFLLRLRTRPTEVAEWLNLDRPIRFQTGYLTATVGEAFDTVIYMNRVGRAIRAAE